MNLTPEEIESLRIAIAEEMGMDDFHTDPDDGVVSSGKWGSRKLVPDYTTSIDAIQKVALERFKGCNEKAHFEINFLDPKICNGSKFVHELSALDWCIAFARAAKIWRYKA